MAKRPKDGETVENIPNRDITQKHRSVGNHWVKGMPSPNPGGRPKGLANAIREEWPPDELQGAFSEIARDPGTSRRDRMEALRWLSDHGYGKAPETHLVGAMTDEQRDAAVELSRDQLLALVETGPPVGGALVDGMVVSVVALPAQTSDVPDPTA